MLVSFGLSSSYLITETFHSFRQSNALYLSISSNYSQWKSCLNYLIYITKNWRPVSIFEYLHFYPFPFNSIGFFVHFLNINLDIYIYADEHTFMHFYAFMWYVCTQVCMNLFIMWHLLESCSNHLPIYNWKLNKRMCHFG